MKKIAIQEAFKLFERENVIKGLSPETVEYYSSFVPLFLNFAGIKYATQLNYDLVECYTAFLRGKYTNPVSINTNLRAVRAFCYFCSRKNFCIPFKVNLVKAPEKVKDPYSEEVVRELVLTPDNTPVVIAILLLISTAIRARTLCALLVKDVDFNERKLYLRVLKNGDESVLPLSDYVSNRLKAYISEYNLQPDNYLFTKSDGSPHNRHTIYGQVTSYLKKRGIESKGLHRFRHTFGAMSAEKGINAFLLKRWMTHRTLEQSQHYVNLYGSDLRDSLKFNPIEIILAKEKDGL